MMLFCCDGAHWLSKEKDHVAVVPCKAGKGRTGQMISAFLLYSKMFDTTEDVLNFIKNL
jgi:phosphatidylinositol-3,4,5-trisphosphate 3-phosphatase/dual-specificity protein phosphatase PTEN